MLLNFGPTFVWVIINLTVLYIVMKRILFKPVTRYMEDRANSISNDIKSAERDKAEAENLKKQYEDQLHAAREEGNRILSSARLRAEKEYNEILSAAREEAREYIEKAKQTIDQERQQMLKNVKNQVASIALAAASKVVEANMDTQSNRALVDKFIDEEGAA